MSKGPVFLRREGKHYFVSMVACRGQCLGFGSVPVPHRSPESDNREPCPDCAGTGLEPNELEGAEAVEAALNHGLLVRTHPEGMREVSASDYVSAYPDESVCACRSDTYTRYTDPTGRVVAAAAYENNYETLRFFLPEDGQ